jgi:hypothetical protein
MSMTDSRQVLNRLARQEAGERAETAVVTSPGARAAAWAIKVKSHVSYNVYKVRAIVIGDAGSYPVEIGQDCEAVNLAEPFLEQGTLPADTYAVMSKVGDKYVFYAKP